MVTSELIKKLKESGLLEECINKGVISFNYTVWVELYDFYINQLEIEKSKMQVIANTAEKFNYSDNMVRYVINIMKS